MCFNVSLYARPFSTISSIHLYKYGGKTIYYSNIISNKQTDKSEDEEKSDEEKSDEEKVDLSMIDDDIVDNGDNQSDCASGACKV